MATALRRPRTGSSQRPPRTRATTGRIDEQHSNTAHRVTEWDEAGTEWTRGQLSRRAISGQRRGSVGRVLHQAPWLQSRPSATARVCRCIGRTPHAAVERTGSVWIAANAGRSTPGAGRMEPHRSSSERPSRAGQDFERRGLAFSKRDGSGPGRATDPATGPRRKPDRVVRASAAIDHTAAKLTIFLVKELE
jgi:hypothetical protein